MRNKLTLSILILCVIAFTNKANAQSTDTTKVTQSRPQILVDQTHQTEPVYETYDDPPIPPGGPEGFRKYLAGSINYPDSAVKANASGTVYVSFTVDKDGTVGDVHVIRDNVGYGCGKEAVRVISNMKNWEPGKINGKPVKVRYNVPVRFAIR